MFKMKIEFGKKNKTSQWAMALSAIALSLSFLVGILVVLGPLSQSNQTSIGAQAAGGPAPLYDRVLFPNGTTAIRAATGNVISITASGGTFICNQVACTSGMQVTAGGYLYGLADGWRVGRDAETYWSFWPDQEVELWFYNAPAMRVFSSTNIAYTGASGNSNYCFGACTVLDDLYGNFVLSTNREGAATPNEITSASTIGSGNLVFGQRHYLTGTLFTVAAGFGHYAACDTCGLLSGELNSLLNNGENDVIAGGKLNTIYHPAPHDSRAGIGWGFNNHITDSVQSGLGWGTANVLDNSDYATLVGGRENYIYDSFYGVIDGGGYNRLYNSFGGLVDAGTDNTVENSNYSTLSGGEANIITGTTYGSISGGASNTVSSANYGTVVGGRYNQVTYQYGTAMGRFASATHEGEVAHASGRFAATGDAQAMEFVARRQVTHSDTNWYTLYLDGASLLMTIPNNGLWNVSVKISGLTSGAPQRFAYNLVCSIYNDGGTTTLGSSTTTTLLETDVNYDARCLADDANDALLVQVGRSAGTSYTVRWVAVVEIAQVIY